MTDTTTFDWRPFLAEWSGEWADCLPEGETQSADDAAARRSRWLGFPPADEARVAAAEARLGLRLPPSYREFLMVSDGWRHAGGFVWLLAGTADARWHDDASGLADMFEEYLDDDAGPQERREAGIWRRGLQLDVASDATYVLMDPQDVDEDGEWAVYTWAGWRAAPPERHANFHAFMREMHREFHCLRARPGEGEPEFVNDTTRRLDALVEEARLAALRGDWEGALRLLDEARAYGRPRAAGLGDQIRRLLGQTYMVDFGGLAADPRYAPELLPLLTAEMPGRMTKGTYAYTATGAFGEAVERARELARWGDTDAAWRELTCALPSWEPLGPDHLAPVGWIADPLLGSLLTAERGRELLSTPRGGQAGQAPGPTPPLDPPGLAWLAEPDPGNRRTCYRFVLVEGVEPEELAARLADGGGAVLDDPMTSWQARQGWSRRRGEFPSYEDRALLAVGRAGDGWSFAFDGDPAPFDRQRFVSPAAGACAGTRAVVVWSGLRTRHGEPFFHLSVARDGVERYAFTYDEGEIRESGESGEIPRTLRPDQYFGDPGDGADDAERALLAAVGGEFGVHLPRQALVHGRLHTCTSRSWTRPPRDGESYLEVRVYMR
ncbi:SMI1/KNR4 family protein [Streptomyces sp. NPDC018026]|uniref:SMI1/KNR4 family protein n=1 Tax=Streptomyces sp. NPDC018026 TaxID=3365031 RepID=UPI0037BAD7F0